jgi:drug/metabolite transporter (DMT)-like permease
VAALASSLTWAAASIVFRRLKGRAPAAAMNLGKNGVAAVSFALLHVAVAGRLWPGAMSPSAHLFLALSGIVGLALCDTFLLRAMLEIGPRRAQLLMCLNPVLVFLAVLLPPWSQHEAAGRLLPWLGLALALGGIGLAATEAPDVPAPDPARRRRGVVDALVAAVLNAAGVLLARLGMEEGAGFVEAAYVRLAVATVALVAGGLLLGRARAWGAALAPRATAVPLALAAVCGTFLGIGFSQAGIEWSESTGAATTINAMAPVWLIPLSAWFLGEPHTKRAWLSAALAIAGIALLAA